MVGVVVGLGQELAALKARVGRVLGAWVLDDAVYGADSCLRRMLEDRHQPYVWRFAAPTPCVVAGIVASSAPNRISAWITARPRSWHGWHRHMSLCMAALAFLAKLSAVLRHSACNKANETSPEQPIVA